MSVDLKLVSQLRDKTGAGLSDCRAALEEANGDLDLAVEIMRKKGEVKAAKKADRATKEGVIATAGDTSKIAVVALACETDFVSRTEAFRNTVKELAEKLLAAPSVEEFKTAAESYIQNELTMKIGENMLIAGAGVYSGGVIGSYIHSNLKIAGVAVLSGGSQEIANDVAMQIAAMKPKYLNPEAVPADVLEKEKEIYREQLKGENKPEQIWDKIIAGKLNKFYEDNCLVSQLFIKDDSKKISDLIGENTISDWALFSL
ncbi:MAG: translation elongation factor Ts [Candidatus Buchananbacteria bacterium]|jgi:elongation factor Ts